ncbi:hypothetical protein FNV43_RR10135 [Rhamnella rubrinervis]|uniref:Uncharacterized protein n=1 Tax=Rhamnella rubrinervis TaxID=2594499 RepID=A0A8K0MKL3_9ROSA|nr:hypothetical protein FNV43_RR10135 [Rhamnella rubrinervis]
MKFNSEPERVKYLSDCRANYESVMSILNDVGKLKTKFQNDNVRAPIAADIFSNTETFINNALQTVRNMTLRKEHLDKINDHVNSLISSMEEMDPQNGTQVQRVGKEVEEYNKAMLAYNTKSGGIGIKELSKMLNASNVSFEKLMQTYQGKFDFPAEFKDLKDVEKQENCGGSWLIDLVSCSGVSPPLSTDGHHCHFVSMPDGAALARQIAYH